MVKVQEELNGVLVGLELLLIQMSVSLCACLSQLQDLLLITIVLHNLSHTIYIFSLLYFGIFPIKFVNVQKIVSSFRTVL